METSDFKQITCATIVGAPFTFSRVKDFIYGRILNKVFTYIMYVDVSNDMLITYLKEAGIPVIVPRFALQVADAPRYYIKQVIIRKKDINKVCELMYKLPDKIESYNFSDYRKVAEDVISSFKK